MGKRHNKKFNSHQRKPYHHKHNKKPFNDFNRENGSAKKEQQEFIVKESLKEDQAGITEYISGGEGFKGILKSRFSDFQVNEIDLSGKISQLTDLSIPEEEQFSPEESALAKEEFKDVIPGDAWSRFDKLCTTKLDNNQEKLDSAIFFDVTALDKEKRGLLHKMIKSMYRNKLTTTTLNGDQVDNGDPDKKMLRVVKKLNGHMRQEWGFPKNYVHFLVYKENMDTSEVASAIANKLNLKPSQVNYCGTKDKRAKTTQKFSIKRRFPRQIVGTVKYLTGVKIGNFEFDDNYLKLGDLKGNRFRVAIRNLTGDKMSIEASLNSVKEKGFINYFGLQRFGNCSSIPTYEVGVALLKGDYKLACELILKPRDNDVPFLKSIRETWWKNRDSKEAAAQFRSDRFIEKKLLDGLAEYGEKDYSAALRKIPRNMLLLYPHSFQSLIFNQVASRRIKEFGISLIPGDLVYREKNGQAEEDECADLSDQDDDHEEDNDKDKDERTETGTENATDNSAVNAESYISEFKKKVKPLTEDEIASGAYTIFDMVLTLPGYDITYPENVVGSWYKELMENYELTSEKLKHKIFCMKGAYRKVVVRPSEMSWEYKSYSTLEETLILSDLEMLKGIKLEDLKKCETEPKYEALLLDFCLPPASYATMMLRELLKCETSSAAQSILQQTAIKQHAAMNEIEKDSRNVEALSEKRKAIDSGDETESVTPAKISKE